MSSDTGRKFIVIFDARMVVFGVNEEEVDRIAAEAAQREEEEDVEKFFLLTVIARAVSAKAVDAGNEPALLGGVMPLSYSPLSFAMHLVAYAWNLTLSLPLRILWESLRGQAEPR